jgi:hypothetical protein
MDLTEIIIYVLPFLLLMCAVVVAAVVYRECGMCGVDGGNKASLISSHNNNNKNRE